jgi:hypothetical protein
MAALLIELELPQARQAAVLARTMAIVPDAPTDDDYILIRVVPKLIEMMDFSRNLILEPFGLKPAVLEKQVDAWHLVLGKGSPEKQSMKPLRLARGFLHGNIGEAQQ